jgi:hypothetical protein
MKPALPNSANAAAMATRTPRVIYALSLDHGLKG